MQHITCHKVNGTIFMHASDCSKTQKMCDKAVEKDSKKLKFVPDYFKAQEISQKAVKKLLLAIIHVLDQHQTQQMCEKSYFKKFWNDAIYS